MENELEREKLPHATYASDLLLRDSLTLGVERCNSVGVASLEVLDDF